VTGAAINPASHNVTEVASAGLILPESKIKPTPAAPFSGNVQWSNPSGAAHFELSAWMVCSTAKHSKGVLRPEGVCLDCISQNDIVVSAASPQRAMYMRAEGLSGEKHFTRIVSWAEASGWEGQHDEKH
jgi:hypothetical protein